VEALVAKEETLHRDARQTSGVGSATGCFAAWLHAVTGGQPLLITQMMHALLEEGALALRPEADGCWRLDIRLMPPARGYGRGGLPAHVQDVIAARLARLAPTARDLLVAAAALGTRFTFEQICRVAAVPEREALEALDALVRHQMLREEDEEGW
jgi:predicted ATPase